MSNCPIFRIFKAVFPSNYPCCEGFQAGAFSLPLPARRSSICFRRYLPPATGFIFTAACPSVIDLLPPLPAAGHRIYFHCCLPVGHRSASAVTCRRPPDLFSLLPARRSLICFRRCLPPATGFIFTAACPSVIDLLPPLPAGCSGGKMSWKLPLLGHMFRG